MCWTRTTEDRLRSGSMSSELVLHCVGLTVWSRLYTPGIPKGSTLQLERAPKTGTFVLTQLMPKKSSTAPGRRHWSTISERSSDGPLTGLPKTLQRVGIAADHGGFELRNNSSESCARLAMR